MACVVNFKRPHALKDGFARRLRWQFHDMNCFLKNAHDRLSLRKPVFFGRFRSLSQRALAGSNVHGQWPASALLEDHREEQLSDGARACADAGHGFCLQPISVLTLCFAGQVGEVHHKERRISVQSVASVCCNKVKLRATGIPLGSFVMNHVYTFARIIKT